MTAINFGSGTVVGRRTDISNPTPSFLGILQDIEIDFDQSLKELIGQQKVAVDVAMAALKITGKAKFARISSSTLRDLLFGSAATVTTGAGLNMVAGEVQTTATTTFTVTNAATFKEDFGVFYQSTGVQFVRVASAPTVGQYSVNETTGVYTIAVTDENKNLLVYYSYGVTTLVQSVIANTNMGTGPSFEMFINETYTNNAGVVNTFNLKLNACRTSKLAFPFKNTDYTIEGFDFQAFADTSGTIGTISTTE